MLNNYHQEEENYNIEKGHEILEEELHFRQNA
jgi:hypothetical protein